MGSTDTLPFHPRMDWLFNQVAWVSSPFMFEDAMHVELYILKLYRYMYVFNLCFLHWSSDLRNMFSPVPTKVFRTDFWMMHYGAGCPKRTTVWSSNGDIIEKLAGA